MRTAEQVARWLQGEVCSRDAIAESSFTELQLQWLGSDDCAVFAAEFGGKK